MRTVSWKQFAKMPRGTIFAFAVPTGSTEIYIKGEVILRDTGGFPIDFWYRSPMEVDYSVSPPVVTSTYTRWGMFDFTQEFSIIDIADIEPLIRQFLAVVLSSQPRNGLNVLNEKGKEE